MENIILTNNKDLRLVSVKVGVLSTLRFELPLVSASATHVEVIVTSGDVPSAYTATFIDATKRWQCDIAASQFPAVGKQSYEVAYVLDGKQFWDGKGWIEIEDATTSGIEPQPRPEPYRYAVVSVNGYGADAQGAVRIPKTFITTDSPATTEGYMEGDIYFNRETGATWTLCNVQGTLTWVFNYKNYYTKAETEEAIDRVAAYYITYDAAGNPFPTYSALANATTVYSGGAVRVPTRNDYCVVLADETHQGAEYRYIYAVAEGETTGSWQPQFPVEGVLTIDQTVIRNSANPVAGGGVWSALWGALAALPTGFTSLYDWVVDQLAGKENIFIPSRISTTQGILSVIAQVRDGTTVHLKEIPTTAMLPSPTTSTPAMDSGAGSAGSSEAYARGDHVHPTDTTRAADNAVVHTTGDETVGGVKTFDPEGVVVNDPQTGFSMKLLDTGIAVTDGSNTAYFYVPNITGGGGTFALLSDVMSKADRAANPTSGNLAALDASGNPTDAGWTAGDLARYALVTKTIDNGAVTLDDRAMNAVAVSSSLASLTVNFPTATSGKVRDFGLRLTVASGITTAPELALPQGVTCENADGEAPEIGADGAATILYFTETAANVFLVKGEVVTAIS